MRKRIVSAVIPLMLFLSACGGAEDESEVLLQRVRGYYLEALSLAGHGEIVADYGQRVYTYGVDFSWNKDGETVLVLTAPENIAGTVARISEGETAMEFEGIMLETGAVSSDGTTPIDLIPTLLRYAREGFVTSCGVETVEGENYLHIVCADPADISSEETEAELWFSAETYHISRGEVFVNGVGRLQCLFSETVAEVPDENADRD